MQPRRGAIAICGINTLGLITSDAMEEITYPDGSKGFAWTGYHITDKVCARGSAWSSRKPIVIGYVEDTAAFLMAL